MTFRVILERDPETGDWAAWVPELLGCVSAGESEEETLTNIREAISLFLRPDPINLEPGAIIKKVSV